MLNTNSRCRVLGFVQAFKICKPLLKDYKHEVLLLTSVRCLIVFFLRVGLRSPVEHSRILYCLPLTMAIITPSSESDLSSFIFRYDHELLPGLARALFCSMHFPNQLSSNHECVDGAVDALSCYHFQLDCRKDQSNAAADALSCCPLRKTSGVLRF